MEKEIIDFLETQRVGVFAIRMLDGSPHGATVHFAYREEPLTFIFLTSPTYRKVEPLKQGEAQASFVVGTSEEVMKTLQMDGVANLADTEELRAAYFRRFPEKLKDDRGGIFFTFTPTWWRFTDWTKPEGKTVLTSE